MNNHRDLTIRLDSGAAEGLGLGEIHLIIATHSPHESPRAIFRTITPVAPSVIGSDQPVPHEELLFLLKAAETAIRDAMKEQA